VSEREKAKERPKHKENVLMLNRKITSKEIAVPSLVLSRLYCHHELGQIIVGHPVQRGQIMLRYAR
jgi:hypothetical protein